MYVHYQRRTDRVIIELSIEQCRQLEELLYEGQFSDYLGEDDHQFNDSLRANLEEARESGGRVHDQG